MRKLIIGFALILAAPVGAKEAAPVASDQIGYIRVLGRLNVNTASKAQLEQVPGLDSTKVDEILRARAEGPVADLSFLDVNDDALLHLKTEGDSNLRRVRQNPVRRVDQSPASAAR